MNFENKLDCAHNSVSSMNFGFRYVLATASTPVYSMLGSKPQNISYKGDEICERKTWKYRRKCNSVILKVCEMVHSTKNTLNHLALWMALLFIWFDVFGNIN